MNTLRTSESRTNKAFTLVELLIVISIIAVLAALIFPAVGFVKKKQLIGKATAELKKLTIAIEGYKTKYGQYPPDNNSNTATKYWVNPLYFELVGTTGPKNLQSGGKGYETLDGSAQITLKVLKDTYNVDGLVNVTRGGGDEGSPAKPFLQDLKADQYGPADNSTPQARVLACTVGWPPNLNYPLAGNPGLNPFQYNSSSPTNNTGSYDLWVDILIAGKTNRISNWNKVPQIVK
jgi:prepilin-type N-terminal cleavage/methylation domain-containing protein